MAKSTNKPWTEEEVELLKKYLNDRMSYKEISKRLNRTEKSIQQKIFKLRNSVYQNSDFKIKGKWSEEEIQLLKKYLDEGYTHKEIALKLNRTIPSISGYIMNMKNKTISTSVKRKKWTKDEEELLLQYYNEGLTIKEISKKLRRNLPSIRCKLLKLLNKDYDTKHLNTYLQNRNNKSKKYAINKYKNWTKDEELRLKEYLEKGYSYETISKILGRTLRSIEHRISLLKEDKENEKSIEEK